MHFKLIKYFLLFFIINLFITCTGVKRGSKQQVDNTKETINSEEAEMLSDEQQEMKFEYLFMEALKEKAIGNPQRAVQLLSAALEFNPQSSATMYELATIHLQNNDLTSSSMLLEKAVSINPDNLWYQMLLAQTYQQGGRLNEAITIYGELLNNDPENPEYLYRKATLLAATGKFGEAVDAYNLLEDVVGINERISVAKQHLYLQNGQVKKAFSEIEKLIDQNPDEPHYYGLLADLYLQEGNAEKALFYYKKIQEIDQDNGFVHFSLANYYMQQGEFDKSFEETKKGFYSEDVDLQTKLQFFLLLTSKEVPKQLDTARENELIDILQETNPNDYFVLTVRAESLLKKGEPEKARNILLKALTIEKNDYIIWERLFFIDNTLLEWDALYKHSEEALEFFPTQAQIYFFNALASLQLEEYDKTLSAVDEGLIYAVENRELEGQLTMLKGEALYKRGSEEEAFKVFDKAVELMPNNHIALNNYAYYLSLARKDLDKAERMSGKVIELFPENATYLDTYAWVLFCKEEYKLARFYMESALKYSKETNSTLLEHYGDILFMLGHVDEAVKQWEKAKEAGDDSTLLERKIREREIFY